MKLLHCIAALSLTLAAPIAAQAPDEKALLAEQRAAIAKSAAMDGEWRGTVTTTTPMGEITLTQTERVGTLAGGAVRMIEGRGYAEDGSLAFNAVAMITYDAMSDEYVMTTTARGFTGRPWFKATETGFEWGLDNGPVKMTYEAVIDGDDWTEIGYMQFGDAPRQKFLEMKLKRIGDTDWPAEGAVGPE
ncbi:MAG: DUF1579 domain-containing protein [Pseudomonadota bacterium]